MKLELIIVDSALQKHHLAQIELTYTGSGNRGTWMRIGGDYKAFARGPEGEFIGEYSVPDNRLFFHSGLSVTGSADSDFIVHKGPANPWDKSTVGERLEVNRTDDPSINSQAQEEGFLLGKWRIMTS